MPGIFYTIILFLLAFSSVSAQQYQLSIDSEIGKKLTNAPENSWVKLNLNHMQDVWTPLDQRPAPPEAPSVGSPKAIIGAWSSMAWDSKRGNIIIWGGGHANYPGNEIYIWKALTLRWERASLPSDVEIAGSGGLFKTVDGQMNTPVSAHTYDNSEYLPISDRFITFGGAAFNTGRYFELDDRTRTGPYLWDPSKANANQVGGITGSNVNPGIYSSVLGGEMWLNHDNLAPDFSGDLKPGNGGTDWINGTTAYATENGKDVLYIQTSSQVYKYIINDVDNPSSNVYEYLGRYITQPFSGQGAGLYDPIRNIYLRSANRVFTFWRLDSPGSFNLNTNFTPTVQGGVFDFTRLTQYGLDYDSKRDDYLLWDGENEVWRLVPPDITNLELGEWVLEPLSPISSSMPSSGNHTGILGKWKYASALDVFLGLFDSHEGQVWAYKPSNWAPDVVEKLPFVVSPLDSTTISLGDDVDITVSSFEQNVSSIEVFVNGNSIGQSSIIPYTLTWTANTAGNKAIYTVAEDLSGNVLTSPTINIFVTDTTNTPPTVTLTSPSNGSTYDVGDPITLTSDATDADGDIVRVEFFQDGTKLGEDTSEPYSFTWTDAVEGNYSLTARAIDDDGAVSASGSVSVSVTVGVNNTLPTAVLTSPSDGSNYVVGETIALSADATDVDGNIVRVEFFQGGTKLGEDTSEPYSFTWTDAVEGNYSLTAVSTDNLGGVTTSSPINIGVSSDPNQVEIIIDNLDSSTTRTGTWSVSSGASPHETNSLYNNASSTFTWTVPSTAANESHEIFVWWTYHNNRSSNVPYRIHHNNGIDTIVVNQHDQSLGGKWVSLGTYTLKGDGTDKIVVSSENGQACADAVRLVRINQPNNTLPTAVLTSPSDGSNYVVGETIALSADATDVDGNIVRVEFFQGGTKLGEDTSEPYSFTWTDAVEGNYSLTAVSTDNLGGVTTSSPINIGVSSDPNQVEIIIDNLDSSTTRTGTWSVSSGASPHETNSLYNNASSTFTWTVPSTAANESHEIFVWWTYHNNRSSNVPYRIHHNNGIDTIVVNQHDQSLGGKWVSLGTYTLKGDGTDKIVVSSENGQACADAVRLVRINQP